MEETAGETAGETAFMPSDFVSMPFNQKAVLSIIQALEIKQAQRTGDLPSEGMGLNGLWIEGPPGIGKSFMIQDCLKKAGYCLRDPAAGASADLRPAYYMISASLDLKEKERILIDAFHQGFPVVLDEADCCMNEGLEKILNTLLTGLDLEGNPATNPGFIWIGTGNGETFHGRTPLSPALKKRCVTLNINHPKKEDILLLLEQYSEKIPSAQHVFFADAFIQLQSAGEMSLRELVVYLDQKKSEDPWIEELAALIRDSADLDQAKTSPSEKKDPSNTGTGTGKRRNISRLHPVDSTPLWQMLNQRAKEPNPWLFDDKDPLFGPPPRQTPGSFLLSDL